MARQCGKDGSDNPLLPLNKNIALGLGEFPAHEQKHGLGEFPAHEQKT